MPLAERALALGDRGRYALQAVIAAEHARAPRAEATDWTRIAGAYDRLARIDPSPVIALNRAVAVAMAFGPRRASRSPTSGPRRSTPTTCSTPRGRTSCGGSGGWRRRGGLLAGS